MIKIFSKTDTDFSKNGDKVLNPLKSKIYKEDNGDYYFEFECSIDYLDYIVKDNIIVAPTPTGEQAFRIDSVEKTRLKIKCKAWHLSYDTENYIIADSYVADKNCNDALDHLNSATDNLSPFIMLSDINRIHSYRCVRKTLYEAIQTVIERWKGHLVRDNYNIAIKEAIGTDNGVTIRYKKNLKEITCTENWQNVVTKIMPVGKDGLLLDEKYLFSDIQHEIPYTKVVSFAQDDIEQENYNSENEYKKALVEDLRQKGKEYLEENKLPKLNYTLSANIDKITDIGDVIEVVDERLGVNILTNVISYEYDPVLKKYTSIEFGNFKNKLSNFRDNISKVTEEKIEINNGTMQARFNNELKNATNEIWGTLENSYVIYEGNRVLIVDSLPKENATNVMLINSAGIGFSNTGVNGTFNSAWKIDGTLDMQQINVINLVADLIRGGTLKLGGTNNSNGIIEIYDTDGNQIGKIDKDGFDIQIAGEKLDNIINSVQTQISDMHQDINGITSSVKLIGGNNLQRNSVGAYGTEDYEQSEEGTIIATEEELLKSKTDNGFGRMIYIGSQKWFKFKSERLTIGNKYTLSFKYSNTLNNQCTVKLLNNTETTIVNTLEEKNLEKVEYTFIANTEIVELYVSTGDYTLGITDYYLQAGENASKWQSAAGEVLSTALSIYYNGIEVTSENSEIITKISNLGFSVVNNNGKILITFNKDKCILSDTQVNGILEQDEWLRYTQTINNKNVLLEVKI